MLSPEYDAIKAMEGPGIHVTATGTYVNYKGIPETVSYTVANPDAPPVDVPSMFYRNGYEAGIKRALEVIVQRSKLLGRMLKWPGILPDEINSLKNQIINCVRLGNILRKLLKEISS